MVGGRRSLGCSTCKLRRVKCDETRPICCRCIKAHRYCPGPEPLPQGCLHSGIVFSTDLGNGQSRDADVSGRLITAENAGGVSQLSQLLRIPHLKANFRQGKFPRPLPITKDQDLAFKLIDAMTFFRRDVLAGTALNTYLPFLPSRVGHHKALDIAIFCLLDRLPRLHQAVDLRETRRHADALRNLRACLSDRKESKSAETLCAALLLHHYELLQFRVGGGPSYLAHAGGSAAIMKARGPSSFQSEFEKAILLAQHFVIVTISMFNASDCFLYDDEWKKVIDESLPPSNGSTVDACSQRIWHKIIQFLGSLPPLMRQFKKIYDSGRVLDTSVSYKLAQEASSQLEVFKDLLEVQAFEDGTVAVVPWPIDRAIPPPPPHRSDHVDGHESCLKRLKMLSFSSIWAARSLTLYWMCRILMSLLLARLEPASQDFHVRQNYILPFLDGESGLIEDKFSVLLRSHVVFLDWRQGAEADRYAALIRASLPYFETFKPFGAGSILSSFQIASAVSTTEEKEWMASRLTETYHNLSMKFFVTYPSKENSNPLLRNHACLKPTI